MATSNILVDRDAVGGQLREAMSAVGRVVLWGPDGSGKTTLLQTVVDDARPAVLTAYPSAAHRDQPYAVLAELLAGVPDELLRELPAVRARLVAGVLRRTAADERPDHVGIRLAVLDLATAMSRDAPLTIAVDDAHRTDPDSADALGFVCRSLRADRLTVLATAADPTTVAGLCGSPCRDLRVPAWSHAETAELIARHGLPSRLAGRIHNASGGNPALALRIAGAIGGSRPRTVLPGRPRIGDAARAITRRRLERLSPPARATLLLAALADAPTAGLLRRCGVAATAGHLGEAVAAGLAAVDAAGTITFTAGAVPETLCDDAGEAELTAAHAALASAVADRAVAVRHRALADGEVSPALADDLDAAAETAHGRGDRRRAAELSLLAAERTPADRNGEAVRRYRTAARHAAIAGDTELTQRAAQAVLDRADRPADRVRACLAVIEAAGQDFDGLDEVFAEAEASAEGDRDLLAAVTLWRAWRAHLRDGSLTASIAFAEQAVDLATGTDRAFLVEALATVARFRFLHGEPGSLDLLDRADALAENAEPVSPHGSPAFVRARLYLFADRLTEARDILLRLVPVAQRLGEMKALVEVWRSLAEVELRAGRCAQAAGYSRRAIEQVSAGEGSPGSPLYVASIVEAAAGGLVRAARYARQGLRASREDHDLVFTSYNLYALGRAQLAGGDTAGAVESLRKVEAIQTAFETTDPAVLRWQPELAEALAADGDAAAAGLVLAPARDAAIAAGRDNVLAELDRAEAAVRLAEGRPEPAAALLHRARERFAAARLPIEEGRTLLAAAGLERRRRRRADARAAVLAAEEIFERCEAAGWLALARREHARLDPAAVAATTHSGLTPAEQRTADLVAGGASNSEVAARLFVSVKTVEATLTRVYRKLGVRSRGQLAAAARNGAGAAE